MVVPSHLCVEFQKLLLEVLEGGVEELLGSLSELLGKVNQRMKS